MKKSEFKKQLKDAIVMHGYWSNDVNLINGQAQKEVGHMLWEKWHDDARNDLKIFAVKRKTECVNLLNDEYTVGQEVMLDGKKASITLILSYGHADIRPPFHRTGCLVLESDWFYGRLTVIPNSWKVEYGDEINENRISLAK